MQITAELDNQRVKRLHSLEKSFKKSTSELIALAIDEIYNQSKSQTEGEKVLDIVTTQRIF
ncbi:antitoxin [Bathymodiolus japonicus methanotrophic gill symbiont]|uniref:hypothetical protein n=1 Tax=Bathymodiolus japonicus methanotrophic gill symbiont TaxID=113269 RepID=UPI001B61D7E8|nr:hypothetical protein [Bathymodiolus japonicus methanotrophic gill symbiont]GFO72511.1 antitoxin [Bathymodiolus japonicus methanotrophic gill symbiont]